MKWSGVESGLLILLGRYNSFQVFGLVICKSISQGTGASRMRSPLFLLEFQAWCRRWWPPTVVGPHIAYRLE